MGKEFRFSVEIDREAYVEGLDELDLSELSPDVARGWLRTMILIREFEAALGPLVQAGRMPGGIHEAIGQEAVAVGVLAALAPADLVASSHRPHHHALAKGMDPRSVMAELFGRATGCVGGRGGTMHLADVASGYLGGNGIVGASLGLVTGAALAAKLQRSGQVAAGFFGDGGANVGRVWENVNLAALWKLPLVAICENNLYAISTDIRNAFAGQSIAARASGFGLAVEQVDGQDVAAVFRAVTAARARAAAGDGPTFIEAVTYRFEGHTLLEESRMNGHVYRADEERDAWRAAADPILRLRQSLHSAGELDDDGADSLTLEAQAVVADAVAFAEASPWPDPDEVTPVVAISFEGQERGRWTPGRP